MTLSALKATIWSGVMVAAGAGVAGGSANAGTGRSIGSADHQTNLARNASLPRPLMTLLERAIAPRTRADNRWRRGPVAALPSFDEHLKGLTGRSPFQELSQCKFVSPTPGPR